MLMQLIRKEDIILYNNFKQLVDKIAKGIRENQKQLDIQKRRMIKKGKEMQKDMLKKTKEMERLLTKKERAMRDQKTIGSIDLYQEGLFFKKLYDKINTLTIFFKK